MREAVGPVWRLGLAMCRPEVAGASLLVRSASTLTCLSSGCPELTGRPCSGPFGSPPGRRSVGLCQPGSPNTMTRRTADCKHPFCKNCKSCPPGKLTQDARFPCKPSWSTFAHLVRLLLAALYMLYTILTIHKRFPEVARQLWPQQIKSTCSGRWCWQLCSSRGWHWNTLLCPCATELKLRSTSLRT